MNSSVTVSVRSLVIALAVAAALVLAYLVGAVQGDASPAAAASTTPVAAAPEVSTSSPTIEMSGTGTATGVPDQLSFKVSVHATAPDVSTALNSASSTTSQVMAAVHGQGVDNDDLQTTGLNIHANYDYGDDGPPVITGYSVSQNLSVLVRSLPDAGKTIAAAADAGGNAIRLSAVRLQVGDEDGLMSRARAAAIEQAKAKATQYAEASDRELGDVLLVREGGGGGGTHARLQLGTAAYEDASAMRAIPIRAGKADLEVKVSVVWSLE